MTHTTKAAVERISQDLGLPSESPYSQDWVYELSSEFRSFAWFQNYADAYRRRGYGDDEKRLLVELMLDVANDLVENDTSMAAPLCTELSSLIGSSTALHRDQIRYWAVSDHSLDDAFAISACARKILRTLYDE
jgi:hypothetical protein